MTAADALRRASEIGVDIALSDGDLILSAQDAPPPELLKVIRREKAGIVALLAERGAWSPQDWLTFYDERAAIAEFDGGQTRDQAQPTALECAVVEWLNRHPCQSDPGHCAWCGEPDRSGHVLVPFGTENHGHTWLHHECWDDWHQDRREQARSFLAALGIPPFSA